MADSLQEDLYLLGRIQVQEQGGTLAIEDLRRLHKLLMKYTDVS